MVEASLQRGRGHGSVAPLAHGACWGRRWQLYGVSCTPFRRAVRPAVQPEPLPCPHAKAGLRRMPPVVPGGRDRTRCSPVDKDCKRAGVTGRLRLCPVPNVQVLPPPRILQFRSYGVHYHPVPDRCMCPEGLPRSSPAPQVVSEADVAKAAAHVGFPAVIKPISGAASIGVIRTNNQEELLKAFKKCACLH